MLKNLRNCRGATAVEFALISIILFLVLFGIIEFGLLLYNKEVITEAARYGTRYGVVCRVDVDSETQVPVPADEIKAEINDYIMKHLVNFGAQTAAETQVQWITHPILGDCLEVEVQYDYHLLVLHGLLPDIVWEHLIPPLKTSTVMRME